MDRCSSKLIQRRAGLFEKGTINQEVYDKIKATRTSRKKGGLLSQALHGGGNEMKATLYGVLREEFPHLFQDRKKAKHESESSQEAMAGHPPIHVVSRSPSNPTQPQDVHIQFTTAFPVSTIVLMPRIEAAKGVFLQHNIAHHVDQYISALSVTAIKEDFHLMYNMSARVDKLISTPSVTNVHGSVYITYNIDGRVGRLFSTPEITDVHGDVHIMYNINAPVDLLVTDLTVTDVHGSVHIHFNLLRHINKHVSVVTPINVRKEICITFDGSLESENLSIPAACFSKLQRILSDTSVLLQRVREADAPLKVYVECLEMERKLLAALEIASFFCFYEMLKRHPSFLKGTPTKARKSPNYSNPRYGYETEADTFTISRSGPGSVRYSYSGMMYGQMAEEKRKLEEERRSNPAKELQSREKRGLQIRGMSGETEEEDRQEKTRMMYGQKTEEERELEENLKTTGDEVHNLDPATGNCKSCAHITNTTHWILRKPKLSIEKGVLVYEHYTLPGSYECTVSGLRWEVADEVTLQFRLADPEIFKAELAMLQYTPIGPLMDIRVLSGEVEEAHLPHFACLEGSDPSFSDAVRVLRGDSNGVSLEKCARLTRSHAVLRHPLFSLVTFLLKMGIPMRSHVDTLIYRTRVVPLTLFIYVVPRDASMITAVEDEARRIGGKRIHKHRPDASIWMNAKFSLKSEKAEISPNMITLKYARPPDLFEVFVENAEESIDLKLISDGDTIWQATLRQVEYSEPSGVTGSPLSASAASEPIPTTASRETPPRGRATSHSEERREEVSLSNTGEATLQYGPTLPGGRNLIATPRIVRTRKRRHDRLLKEAQGPVSGDIGMAASDMDDALGSPLSASAASEPIPTTASTETRPRGRATSTETQPRGRATSRSEQRREEASLSNTGQVSKVQKDLINRGSEGLLRDMLDSLQAERPSVVRQREVNNVLQGSRVLQDQWSSLLIMLQNKGERACGIMLRVLRDLDPLFYEDLGL